MKGRDILITWSLLSSKNHGSRRISQDAPGSFRKNAIQVADEGTRHSYHVVIAFFQKPWKSQDVPGRPRKFQEMYPSANRMTHRRRVNVCQSSGVSHTGFDEKLEKATKEERAASKKKQEIRDQITSLEEQEKLASKLQLKDNKCPVCESTDITKLNPFFQEERIKDEIIKLQQDIKLKEEERIARDEEIIEFTKELDKVRDAETILGTHSIKTEEQLLAIQRDIEVKEKKLPLADNENLEDMSQIDEQAKSIFEKILTLESETKGFDVVKFDQKIIKLKENIGSKKEEEDNHSQEKIEATNKLKEISAAETILETYSIKNEEELASIKEKIEAKEKKLPLADNENLEDMSQIDEQAKSIFEKILTLESETKGFDVVKFDQKIIKLKENIGSKKEEEDNSFSRKN